MFNLELFKQDDPSGSFSKEKWLASHYPEEYNLIIKYCSDINLTELPFKEKVYVTIHKLDALPICDNAKCDNKVKFKNRTIGYNKYCSNKCQSSSIEIINKRKNTNKEKYGHEIAVYNDEIKNKFITNLNKIIEERGDEINKNRKNTCLSKYGVDSIAKTEDVIKKRVSKFKANIEQYRDSYKKTSLERYGTEHPFNIPAIFNKSKLAFKEKYGYDNPMDVPEIKNKAKDTLIEKYGVDHYSKTKEWKDKFAKSDIWDDLLRSKYEDVDFLSADREKIFKTGQRIIICNCVIHGEFNITYGLLHNRHKNNHIICTKCNDPKQNSVSIFEQQVESYVKEVYTGEVILNSRDIIKPKELDIYLPELKIGIECNGVYWHSELFRDKNYHRDKFNICKESNIKLIQIWEDDWFEKPTIIKSRINNILKLNTDKIFTRNTTIRKISTNDCRAFFDENHLQGFVSGKNYYALYYNDEMIAGMILGKLRKSLGQNKEGWELFRFCSKVNCNVVGAASKLFKYFLNEETPNYVISYANLEWGEGEFYNHLGFNFDGFTDVGYWYLVDNKKENRFKFRKDVLVRKGNDSSKTESDIMKELGYYRIWNTGNARWVYQK